MSKKLYGAEILSIVLLLLGLMGCAITKQQGVIHKTTAKVIGNLDNALGDLTNQIVNSMAEKGKKKVAVIEFSDLNGRVTEFGKYLAEELITRLFMTKKFEVIERQLLNKVLKEQKLSLTGVLDPSSVKTIGTLLGVDAIVSGTITDLGTSLKVNARIISTETGTVFAVAATEIVKDATVRKLMSRVSAVERSKEPEKRPIERKLSTPQRIFFKQDFSEVEEGEVPEGWLGCEHLLVKTGRGQKKYLTYFEEGPRRILIPNGKFPANFKLDIIGKFSRTGKFTRASHTITIGNLKAGVSSRWQGPTMGSGGSYCSYAFINKTHMLINKTHGITRVPIEKITTTKLSLTKKGPVFRFLVDDAEKVLVRHADFTPPPPFVLDFNDAEFVLYEIIGTDLGE